MKSNEASMTSLISAFGRAYHHLFDTPVIFDDFIAPKLLSKQEFEAIKMNMIKGISFFNPEMAGKLKNQPDEILKWVTQIQLSPTPLARAAFCEKVLLHEVSLGVTQYIVLGAGMDTFALRHPQLEYDLSIYEVDFPATQQFKLNKLKESNLHVLSNLHFIPCDFTKKISADFLFENGVKREKTFFSLLGVSYYLSKDDLKGLLMNLLKEMPEGSSIVFDYADENLFTEKGLSNRVENMVKLAAASGEPMKSHFTYKEMESLLGEAGLLIYEHLSPEDIQMSFFNNRHDYLKAFETVHFMHAVKK
ncbi:SAM-dependent methyltransferase [Pradoshia eiseniae]|uniref:S-adenosyl-L-methionine-dependent methyltransferase n=1 Tax=Pradoshia eiseniae TaxID=2064768 RepID=A0A2S7N2T9_9BACI|nr:class I SAM-dependent methyltransferase [Pradoshia eiseniae]PQD96337.1 SAM-dependent methyltransferase [Pradoshia eiseniae]